MIIAPASAAKGVNPPKAIVERRGVERITNQMLNVILITQIGDAIALLEARSLQISYKLELFLVIPKCV